MRSSLRSKKRKLRIVHQDNNGNLCMNPQIFYVDELLETGKTVDAEECLIRAVSKSQDN